MKLTPETKALYVAEMRRRQAGYDYLAKERVENVRKAITAENVAVFDGLFEFAVRTRPPLPTSGLIEYYEILAKSKR